MVSLYPLAAYWMGQKVFFENLELNSEHKNVEVLR